MLVLLGLALLLLNACSSVPVAKPGAVDQAAYEALYKQRAERIGDVSSWGLVGRISLDDGEQGGSGRIQWKVRADHSTIDFHGAMGRGAWHLETGPDGASLRLADGGEYAAPAVDALIQQQMGWPVPVEALQWWVRGLAAPGPATDQLLDQAGLLVSLEQFGWLVSFNRYASPGGVAMPTRMDARRDDYRVKLAISRWQMSVAPVSKAPVSKAPVSKIEGSNE